jgi:DNA-binding CsgD family transcriptional regulator
VTRTYDLIGIQPELTARANNEKDFRIRNDMAEDRQPRQLEKHAFHPSRSGFLLVDPSLMPIYYNSEAIQILTYPEIPQGQNPLESVLMVKVHQLLIDSRSSEGPVFRPEFISGRRRYICRALSVDSPSSSAQKALSAVLLERRQQRSFDGSQLVARFHLSQREKETIELLVYGLTSKEIANRLHISPSTVKAFLRITMVKMGITTRSGIVGRVFASNP